MDIILDKKGRVFQEFTFSTEAEFERHIVENAASIFGSKGIYFDIKKKIGISNQGAAIPDGYFLDLAFHDSPSLYFVEIETSEHDYYTHIARQIMKFGISSEMTKHKIKKILIDDIESDEQKKRILNSYFEKSRYKNINILLDKLIFEQQPSVIIVIDYEDEHLSQVLSQLKPPTEIIEVKTFKGGSDIFFKFKPFQKELEAEENTSESDLDELDTIIVPAREEGFREVFLGADCWYQIRISISMLDKIKYIAAYRAQPTSAITHIAEIDKIEKYKDTNKYILHFKGSAKEIRHVPLGTKQKGKAPQAPRYANYDKLLRAEKFEDIW